MRFGNVIIKTFFLDISIQLFREGLEGKLKKSSIKVCLQTEIFLKEILCYLGIGLSVNLDLSHSFYRGILYSYRVLIIHAHNNNTFNELRIILLIVL